MVCFNKVSYRRTMSGNYCCQAVSSMHTFFLIIERFWWHLIFMEADVFIKMYQELLEKEQLLHKRDKDRQTNRPKMLITIFKLQIWPLSQSYMYWRDHALDSEFPHMPVWCKRSLVCINLPGATLWLVSLISCAETSKEARGMWLN